MLSFLAPYFYNLTLNASPACPLYNTFLSQRPISVLRDHHDILLTMFDRGVRTEEWYDLLEDTECMASCPELHQKLLNAYNTNPSR